MPNRILKDSICTSPNIDTLSRDAECFFYRLLVQCDDFGRMDARTAIIRAKCYPLQYEKVTTADISAWLDELQIARLITVYVVDELPYLQVLTWDKHQQARAKRSKYPAMIADDIKCNQTQADDCIRLLNQSNPIQSESNPNTIVVVVAEPPPPEVTTAEPPVNTTADPPVADVAAVFSAWQDNMPGTITPVISDDLADLVKEHGAREVLLAITEATRAGIRNMRYVTGILRKRQNGEQGPPGPPRPEMRGPNGNTSTSRGNGQNSAAHRPGFATYVREPYDAELDADLNGAKRAV